MSVLQLWQVLVAVRSLAHESSKSSCNVPSTGAFLDATVLEAARHTNGTCYNQACPLVLADKRGLCRVDHPRVKKVIDVLVHGESFWRLVS